MSKYEEFEALLAKADAAGKAAVEGLKVVPMVVTQVDLFDKPVPGAEKYYVADGVCGFAWVKFKGTDAFAKYLKAKGLAHKGYPGGLEFSVRGYNQSVQKKEAYAQAFAKVCKEAGHDCYANSRLD